MQVQTFPSHDLAFRRAVEHVLGAEHDLDPRDIETRLRLLYPRVTLVARHVSGDLGRYYAYRDGRIVPEVDEPWWTLPDTPRVTLSAATGRVTSASPTAAAMMNGASDALVGTRFADLLVPTARDLGATLYEAVAGGGEVRSQAIVQRLDGSPLPIEFRAVRHGNDIDVAYRPLASV